MLERIGRTADYLASNMKVDPEIGMITGTGLGGLTEKMTVDVRLPYRDIPDFPLSTVAGHAGTLAAGRLRDRPILAQEGRFHLYEGYTPQEVTFSVRVMARLGIRFLLISSATGGLNPLFQTGDLMLVTDHINLSGAHPLTGPNLDAFGPRFPDMTEAYDPGLAELARQKARTLGITLREGVYVCVHGPSLETPAETRFLRMIGGDAVGMSTVPEAITGVHCGLRILSIVVITNMNLPERMERISGEAVVAAAQKAAPGLASLWEEIVAELPPAV
jgi:purine-nucleoside phosphorylase